MFHILGSHQRSCHVMAPMLSLLHQVCRRQDLADAWLLLFCCSDALNTKILHWLHADLFVVSKDQLSTKFGEICCNVHPLLTKNDLCGFWGRQSLRDLSKICRSRVEGDGREQSVALVFGQKLGDQHVAVMMSTWCGQWRRALQNGSPFVVSGHAAAESLQ